MGPQGHPYSPFGTAAGSGVGEATRLTSLSHHVSSSATSVVGASGSIPLSVTLGGSHHHHHSPHQFGPSLQHPSLSFLPRKQPASSFDFLGRAAPPSGIVHSLPIAGISGVPSSYLPSHFFNPTGLHAGVAYRHPLLPSLYSLPTPPAAAVAAHHSFQTLLASLTSQRPKLSSDGNSSDYHSLLNSLSSLHQQQAAVVASNTPPTQPSAHPPAGQVLPLHHSLLLAQVFGSC